MTIQTHPLFKLIEKVYPQVKIDFTTLSEHLDLTNLPEAVCISKGHYLETKHCKNDYKWFIAKGKFSVKNEFNTEIAILGQGAIIDQSSFSGNAPQFLTLEEVILCPLPTHLLSLSDILQESWLNTLHSLNPPTGIPANSSCKNSELTELFPSRAFQPNNKGITPIGRCLLDIFDFFHLPQILPIRDQQSKYLTLDELATRLEFYGFSTHKQVISLKELSEAKFPFLVESPNKQYHLLINHKANALWEYDSGSFGSKKFDQTNVNPETNVNILTLKLLQKEGESALHKIFSLSWYIDLFASNWVLTSQLVLCSVLSELFAIGMPILYMVIFDRVFSRQNLDALNVITIGILIVLCTDYAVRQLRSYVLAHQLEVTDKLTLQAFLKQVLRLPLSKLSQETIRSCTDKFLEIPKNNETVASLLLITSLDVISSTIITALLLLLNVKLALVSLLTVIPMGLVNFWINPAIKKRAAEQSKNMQQSKLKIAELLENQDTIKPLNANQFLKWESTQLIETTLQKGFRSRFDSLNQGSGQNFIAQLGAIATLYVGAQLVLSGEISFGVYMAVNMLSRHVLGLVQKLFLTLMKFNEAKESINEVQQLFASGITIEKNEGVQLNKALGHFKLSDICFQYNENASWKLSNVSTTIKPGDKIVITGQSGSGKSTLLKLLQNLYPLTSGYITFDGYNLNEFDINNLRSKIGIVPQKTPLFSGTLEKNILLAKPTATAKEVLDAISFSGLDQWLLSAPKGLQTPIIQMGLNLSAAQAACIGIARLYLINPDVVLIDDVFKNIDPSLTQMLLNRILERYKHKTCIFVNNTLPLHQKATRILLMHEGQLSQDGHYNDLIRQKGHYFYLFHDTTALNY